MIREEIYKFFADYIFANSGMVYSPTDYYRLDSRINELVKLFSVKDVEEIYEMYKKNITPDMKAVLINISTNNETYFFRDVKPFSVFSKQIIPEILKKSASAPINVWSAASSTGQETYSMIMSLQNSTTPAELGRIKFSASDISTDALNKAKKGIYNGLDVQRGLPAPLLVKYFTQLENNDWQINPDFVSKVKFYIFNLLKDQFPKETYDIIFCRNVLIYQNPVNKNQIINNLFSSLKPGGYLFLGNGESLIGNEAKFNRITMDGYTIYQK